MTQLPPKHLRLKQAMRYNDQVTAEACRRSLFFFMQEFWDQVSTDTPSWNWHIPYLCSQLMKEAYRVVNQLPRKQDIIINVPPGTTKSMTCSIMFPVWCWINWHWLRFITGSYSSALALELAEYSREIVRSKKFKRLFPEIVIKRDKDTKSNFKIQKIVFDEQGKEIERLIGGNRFSASVGSTITGFHGHFLIVDDPIDPTQAIGEAGLKTANHWVSQTLSTRKINKAVTSTILIMQRLHQNDPTGALLDNPNKAIFHICLPGEIRNYKDKVNPPALVEFYKDDLLDPKRMSWAVLEDMEADLGQYGLAGQVGQNPTPPGGAMFKVDNFQYIDRLPDVKEDPKNKIIMTVRYWDKAGSQGKGAFTVGVKMSVLASGKFVILDVKRGQWSTEIREKIIRSTTEADGTGVVVYQEQEPGSGGKESAEATILNLSGYTCYADRPTGDKVYRADPYSVQVNNGNVLLMRADWNHAFIEEHKYFPFGTNKDQVDSGAGAFNKLRRTRNASIWSVNFA